MEQANGIYNIQLEQFEGPFDLLLFFIQRDELDIYNIPIQKITADFMTYIEEVEDLNIEQASEFILFAATLMRIKSKMLLPRKEVDEEGNEIDPRQELIDKLLEYKRFKEAAAEMKLLEAERQLQLKRGNAVQELMNIGKTQSEGTEGESLTTFKLIAAYERVLKKLDGRVNKPEHVVVKYNYSMQGQRNFIHDWLKRDKKISFEQFFQSCENRVHAIFNLLAILELSQGQYIKVLSGEGRNNFILEWTGLNTEALDY
jgi:segregation and condensation protein A